MSYVIEFPVDAGGSVLVQADEDDLPGSLELATLRPGEVAVRARESVEAAVDQIKPAITAVTSRLAAMTADEVAVEFGIVLGAETGAIIAKGTAEVHFTVTLTWKRGTGGQAADGNDAGGQAAGGSDAGEQAAGGSDAGGQAAGGSDA